MMWLTLQALEYRLELCRAALVGAAEPSTYYLVENRRLQLTYWVGLLTWIDHHELYNFRHQGRLNKQEHEQQQTGEGRDPL